MRGHTAQMPSSVKCFTRTGKSHAFYHPILILPADFAVSAFALNPYSGGDHLSPTSQFVLSQHSLFVCWYLLHINVKTFRLLLPSCFQVPSSLWHRYLLGQCACVQPFRYQRHLPFIFPPLSAVVVCGNSGKRREGECVGWRMLLLCLVSEQTSSLCTNSLASSWKGVVHQV